MTSKEIIQYRLLNQHIVNTNCNSAYEVVKSLGAIQAQDYYNALWAVGLRMSQTTEADIEGELNGRRIVRTWPMRGTLHFVAAEDIKWMLELMPPRIISKAAGIYKRQGLNDEVFNKSKDLFIKSLEVGKSLTRDELYKVLTDAGISTEEQRGLHIIGHHAQKGLICFGARKGKQHSFVLLDEWLPGLKTLTRQESLAEIALRYFKSHGPATLNDFVWWTGLKVSEAKEGIEMVKEAFRKEIVNGETYYMKINLPELGDFSKSIFLLPAFDEYLVAYSDRSAALEPSKFYAVFTKNGIFSPTIAHGGKVKGTWKRTFAKDKVIVDLKGFEAFNKTFLKNLNKHAKRLAAFLDKSLQIKYPRDHE